MAVYTHDQIKVPADHVRSGADGPLDAPGVLWGANALQSIQINRNYPRDPQQAIGHLGIVDYTTGTVTSDLQLDCILVEGCIEADLINNPSNNSIYRYALKQLDLGSESYVLTNFSMSVTAGQPASIGLGYLTAGPASELATQAQPTMEQGEESSYAVVMGDDGNGLILTPTWVAGTAAVTADTIPTILADGTLGSYINDSGIPVGVQSMTFNASINRDNVLDVRSSAPAQFITSYPLQIQCDLETFEPPTEGGAAIWNKLADLTLQAGDLNKHVNSPNVVGKNYLKAVGFRLTSSSESVSVNQYLTRSASFELANLILPMYQLDANGDVTGLS